MRNWSAIAALGGLAIATTYCAGPDRGTVSGLVAPALVDVIDVIDDTATTDTVLDSVGGDTAVDDVQPLRLCVGPEDCAPHEACIGGRCLAPPEGMALVPGGTFQMGCAEGMVSPCFADEVDFGPRYVATFAIDIYEATVAEVAAFLAAAGNDCAGIPCVDVEDRDSAIALANGVVIYDGSASERPASELTWHGADAYCRAAGKRLCREAEWEKAARGIDARPFPWGASRATCEMAVMQPDDEVPGCNVGFPDAVGSRPAGVSPYGVHDLAGNVAEWTADVLATGSLVNPADGDSVGEQDGDTVDEVSILKGGSYDRPWYQLTSYRRDFAGLSVSHHYTGVRCCVGLTPATRDDAQ